MAGAGIAAAAGSGSISGRVTDASGTPLEGICVNAENGPSTQTDNAGSFVLSGLDAGSYRLQYVDCSPTPNYVSQWYLGHQDEGSADQVAVADGTDTPVQDVQLTAGVAVSGSVTDLNGTPIAGLSVNVNSTDPGGPSAGTQTDASGSYTAPLLPSGQYRVQFSDAASPPAWARRPPGRSARTVSAPGSSRARPTGPPRAGATSRSRWATRTITNTR